jgi:hypothetical protein
MNKHGFKFNNFAAGKEMKNKSAYFMHKRSHKDIKRHKEQPTLDSSGFTINLF